MTAVAQKNGRTAAMMALLVAAMVGLAFASVPLYRLFCQVTGFGGTPVRSDEAPGAVAGQVGVRFDANIEPSLPWRFEPVQKTIRIAPGARTQIFYRATNLSARTITGQAVFNVTPDTAGQIGVRFDANINPALPWRFEPVQKTVRVHPGARTQIAYRATNLTARRTTGTAVFNVTPTAAGKYFSKIECFCFSEQTLKGGESVDMPVVFFVDPKLREDPDLKSLDEITLSYTFYPVESPGAGS